MTEALLEHISELTSDEKLDLIDYLWLSYGSDGNQPEDNTVLSQHQIEELDKRRQRHQSNPSKLYTLEELVD